jgi:hypothetical protein
LEDSGDADLDELVEVARGDGEKFDALEERVGGVVGFFQNAAVELEPPAGAGEVLVERRGAVCLRTAMRPTRLNQGCAGKG